MRLCKLEWLALLGRFIFLKNMTKSLFNRGFHYHKFRALPRSRADQSKLQQITKLCTNKLISDILISCLRCNVLKRRYIRLVACFTSGDKLFHETAPL